MKVSLWWAVAFVVLVLLLAVVIWSIKRHRDPKLDVESDSPIEKLMPFSDATLASSSLSSRDTFT